MSRSEWSSPKRRSNSENDPLTLKLVDLGLLLIILVAPFFMGGRQAFGQVVLCGLACFTATSWAIHQWMIPKSSWKFSGAEPFILAGIGLITFQCLPISHELLHVISPKLSELLPMWSPDHAVLLRAGTWNTVTVTPADTLSNLIVVITCVLIFFVGVQRVRTAADVRKLLHGIALSGTAMAIFGIAQFLVGNGKFFWLYENPFTDTRFVAKGAFTNANHFANFLAMTIPIQLSFLVSGQSAGSQTKKIGSRTSTSPLSSTFELRDSTGLWAISLAITGVAILLSMSRGGIVFSMLGVLCTLFLFWRKSLLSPTLTMLVMSLSVISLGMTLMFGDLAIKMIEQNFNELTSTDVNQLDQSNARRNIWEANLSGIQEFPLLGTGLGSHREVYWMWFDHPQNGTEYTHAESGFLQVALETGLVGFAIAMMLWTLVLSWCLRGIWRQSSPENAATICAISAALLINFLHSITDFVWYAPACMIVALLLAACACKLSSTRILEQSTKMTETRSLFSISRLSWGCSIPLTLMLGVWMTNHKLVEAAAEPTWFRAIQLAEEFHEDPLMQERLERRRIRMILQAADENPNDQRIQLQAGLACITLFDFQQKEVNNQMPLNQIRDAALSAFEDSASRNEWLNKPGVMGESRIFLEAAADHFRRSLELCPLQPQPYLQLAELVWLEGVPIESEAEFVQQAVTVRPYNARARFALGRTYWLAGDEQHGIEHWQEAFRLDPQYRGHLISMLSSYIPASFFLENFDPDLESLRQLKVAYETTEDQAGYRNILQKLALANARAAMLKSSLHAEENWLEAHTCFDALGNQRAAYESAKEALSVNPSSYKAHLTFAMWTFDNGLFKEAHEHLSWCQRRKPDIQWLDTLASQALVAIQTGVVPVGHENSVGTGR